MLLPVDIGFLVACQYPAILLKTVLILNWDCPDHADPDLRLNIRPQKADMHCILLAGGIECLRIWRHPGSISTRVWDSV